MSRQIIRTVDQKKSAQFAFTPHNYCGLQFPQIPSTGEQNCLKLQFMANNQATVSVYFRLPNGNGCLIDVASTSSLRTLAAQLKNSQLELPHTYRFVIRGQRVKDYSQTLTQLGVRQNSIIHIEPENINQNGALKIDVAFLVCGEKWVVNISREDTIWDLKTGIFQLTSISPKLQTLVFLGKRLKNHKTLKHYKIDSDSLLNLLVDSPGYTFGSQKEHQFASLDLVTSVCSLTDKRSGTSKTSLFRSDSITKKVDSLVPYEISIRENNKGVRESSIIHPCDLFNSCKHAAELKNSFTFDSLFESAGLMKQHESFEEDLQEPSQIEKFKAGPMLKHIQSKKSFEINQAEMVLQ